MGRSCCRLSGTSILLVNLPNLTKSVQGLHDLLTEMHAALISEDCVDTMDAFNKFTNFGRAWNFPQAVEEFEEMRRDGSVPTCIMIMKRLELLEDLTSWSVGDASFDPDSEDGVSPLHCSLEGSIDILFSLCLQLNSNRVSMTCFATSTSFSSLTKLYAS